ncbi:MAG: aspartate dehydrogenase [Firmicutes bacterium]|nr:aspartate dehydrogenase [Bacillota bacterium]
MGLFRKKTSDVPVISLKENEPVLRCSICTGEQVLCVKDRETGKLRELMLIRSMADLEEFCDANGIDPASVRKVY